MSRVGEDPRARRRAEFGRALPRGLDAPPDFRGVVLQPSQLHPQWIDGLLQVSTEEAEACAIRPVQRFLVATLTRSARHGAWNLAGERVLFAEDEEDAGAFRRGRFRLSLATRDQSEVEAGWLSVSWGRHVSNVIAVPPKGGVA